VADVLTPILGRFINAVLNFLVVGTTIYFMVVVPTYKGAENYGGDEVIAKEGEKLTLTYPKVFP
jgi:large-conductance mechanosensitive channel